MIVDDCKTYSVRIQLITNAEEEVMGCICPLRKCLEVVSHFYFGPEASTDVFFL